MAEIRLYRGIRIDNGEFVYGGIGKDSDGTYILSPRKNKLFWVVPVLPESVGQSIGETDKNGTEIFEGDKFELLILSTKFEYKHKETLSVVYKKTAYYLENDNRSILLSKIRINQLTIKS